MEAKISSETSLTLPIESASHPKHFNFRQQRCDEMNFRNELVLVTKRQRKSVCLSAFSKYRLSTSGQSDARVRLAHHGQTCRQRWRGGSFFPSYAFPRAVVWARSGGRIRYEISNWRSLALLVLLLLACLPSLSERNVTKLNFRPALDDGSVAKLSLLTHWGYSRVWNRFCPSTFTTIDFAARVMQSQMKQTANWLWTVIGTAEKGDNRKCFEIILPEVKWKEEETLWRYQDCDLLERDTV